MYSQLFNEKLNHLFAINVNFMLKNTAHRIIVITCAYRMYRRHNIL